MLLAELGIAPRLAPTNTVRHWIFNRAFSVVTDGRFDAPANWKELNLKSKLFPARKLTDLVSVNPPTCFDPITNAQSVSFVPMDAVSETFGEISDRQKRPLEESGSYYGVSGMEDRYKETRSRRPGNLTSPRPSP